MVHFKTSPDVHRYFCHRCGATVFWLKDGQDSVDVGAGLLRSLNGAKVEDLLVWDKYDDYVAHQGDAIDPVFVNLLAKRIQMSRTCAEQVI